MRIYLAETQSGGMVKLSFEVGKCFDIIPKIVDDDYPMVELSRIGRKGEWDYFRSWGGSGINLLRKQGYTDQKYAIEIRDVREEDLQVDNFLDKNNLHIWRTPRSFQCVGRYLGSSGYGPDHWEEDFWEEAILMPIHKKWIDMIRDGSKTYIFVKTLPVALR